MCFGIRILSLFQLGTLQILIQNLKFPKHATNACPDITLLSSEFLVYSKLVEALHALKKKYFNSLFTFSSDHIWQYNALQHTILCDSWIEVPANTDWIWTAGAKTAQYKLHFWRMGRKSCPGYFIAFLGPFRFWMGICNVPKWNELEILIPKHMWKS